MYLRVTSVQFLPTVAIKQSGQENKENDGKLQEALNCYSNPFKNHRKWIENSMEKAHSPTTL